MTNDLIETRHRDLDSRLDALIKQRECEDMERAILALSHVQESQWGDIVPRSDYPSNDWGISHTYYTTFDDRDDGKFLPVYETDIDLRRQRAMSRWLASFTSVSTGALTHLYNTVNGAGFTFKAAADERMSPPQGLAETAQQILDEFCDLNDFHGCLDKEIHNKSRTDGEHALHLKPHQHNAKACALEPEQIVEPANKRQLDDWRYSVDQNLPELPTSWSFGVHSLRRDASHVFGYHVVYDGSGRDWEYLNADEVLHIRRNVPLTAKRGVTDFLPVGRDICANDKLTKMLGIASPVIASIIGVRKYANGTQQGAADSMLSGKGDRFTRYTQRGTAQTVQSENIDGARFLNAGGFDYVNGPLGARENSALLLVGSLLLRSIGTNWLIPEYVISNDPSNGSYASTSVAAQTSAEARKADQRFYGWWYTNLMWKVLKIAYKLGRFERFGLSWDHIERLLTVTAEGPQITTESFTETVTQITQQVQAGLLSKRTAMTRLGSDPDAELEQLGQEKPVMQPGPDIRTAGAAGEMKPNPTLSSALQGALESVSTGVEARAILERFGSYP